FQRLARQTMHQVQVEVVESGVPGHVDRGQGFAVVMDTPQGLEMDRIETLDADRQPVDAGGPVVPESGLLESPGVGFQGDLDIQCEGNTSLHDLQQPIAAGGGEQAWRAAAAEDRPELAAMDLLQVA